MRARPALACLLAALLAGCAADAPQPATDAVDDPVRSTGAAGADGRNRTRVLDYAHDHDLNSPIPPTTMLVGANATGLEAKVSISSSGPCGVSVGEPGEAAAWVEFVSPSRQATRLDATGYACRAGPLTAQGSAPSTTTPLGAEAGEWEVRFGGRGLSARLHVAVDAFLA